MNNQKLVPQLDDDGYFVGMSVADESPLEPGVFLIPAGAVDVAPPDEIPGYRTRWDGSKFIQEPVPSPPPPSGPPPESTDQSIARLSWLVQQRLDTFAQERQYAGILSACSFAVSEVPQFRAEGLEAVRARDEIWVVAIQIMADVAAGKVAPPSTEEFLAMLPTPTWTA